MIEIMNLSIRVPEVLLYLLFLLFKIIKVVVIGILALGLVQMGFWGLGKLLKRKIYFPFHYRICQMVFDNIPDWWKKTRELLFYKPQGTEVVGFFLTLIWPFLICLNVLLMAQVLELFFPGGRRIPLPWVGTYTVFPLIMGFLFAISQTLLAVLAEFGKSRWGKISLMTIVVLTFFVESGLAAYRAWLLSIGEEIASPTMWDTVMSRGGVVLGGFLGFIVPIAETFVGKAGFLKFMEPITLAFLHWFGGVMALIRFGAAWWICGFYSERPEKPEPPERIRKVRLARCVADLGTETGKLQTNIGKLKEDTKNLRKQMALGEKLDKLRRFDEQKQEVDKLKKEIEDEGWNSQIQKFFQEIEQAKDWKLLNQIKKRIKEINNKIEDVILNKVGPLKKEIIGLSQVDNWEKDSGQFRERFGSWLKDVENDWQELSASSQLNNLKDRAQAIKDVLMEKPPAPHILSSGEVDDLETLRKDVINDPDPDRKEELKDTLSECRRVVDEALITRLPKIEKDLVENIKDALEELRRDFDGYTARISNLPVSYEKLGGEIVGIGRIIDQDKKEFKGLRWKCLIEKLLLLLPGHRRKIQRESKPLKETQARTGVTDINQARSSVWLQEKRR